MGKGRAWNSQQVLILVLAGLGGLSACRGELAIHGFVEVLRESGLQSDQSQLTTWLVAEDVRRGPPQRKTASPNVGGQCIEASPPRPASERAQFRLLSINNSQFKRGFNR